MITIYNIFSAYDISVFIYIFFDILLKKNKKKQYTAITTSRSAECRVESLKIVEHIRVINVRILE